MRRGLMAALEFSTCCNREIFRLAKRSLTKIVGQWLEHEAIPNLATLIEISDILIFHRGYLGRWWTMLFTVLVLEILEGIVVNAFHNCLLFDCNKCKCNVNLRSLQTTCKRTIKDHFFLRTTFCKNDFLQEQQFCNNSFATTFFARISSLQE